MVDFICKQKQKFITIHWMFHWSWLPMENRKWLNELNLLGNMQLFLNFIDSCNWGVEFSSTQNLLIKLIRLSSAIKVLVASTTCNITTHSMKTITIKSYASKGGA